MSRLNRRARSISLATVLGLSLAGIALAQQQPYFRMNPSGSAGLSGSAPDLTPPTSTPAGPVDFSEGGTTDYQIRTVVGEPFSLELSTVNGVSPISWLAAPADLPQGISYTDGLLYGFAGAPFSGMRSFVAQDSTGAQATGRVNFQIVNAAVSLSRVKPLIRVGASYVGDLSSNVRGAVYSFTGVPGLATTAPDANSKAALAGIATTPGTYPIVATVGRPGTTISAQSQSSTVTVAPGLAIAFVPNFISSMASLPVDVEARASGVVGNGAPILVSPAPSVLSARGLAYANGRLTGTLAQGAATTLTLRLTDSADSTSVTASLAIPESTGVPAAIEIGEMRPNESPEAAPGEPARIVTTIVDPVCTTTQSVPGIVVTSDCLITGSPTSPGNYTLGVSIVPAANPSATPAVVTAPVVVHPTLIAAPASHNAAPGAPVSLVVNTSGIVGTPSFSLVGTTPAALEEIGLAFNPATGAVTGTPSPGVNLAFEVEVVDSKDGATTRGAFTVVTAAAATSVEQSVVNLRPGTQTSRQATTNIANARWSLLGAPAYVAIDEVTGLLTYTGPAATEIASIPAFAVRASNAIRPQVFHDATVAAPGTVRPDLSLTVDATATGRSGTPFSLPFTVVGASTPVVTLTSGAMVSGLQVSPDRLHGTPQEAISRTLTFQLRDDADGVTSQPASVTVSISGGLGLTYTSSNGQTPGKGALGQALTLTPQPANSVGSLAYAIVSADTLTGSNLTLNPSTGVISGTPTVAFNKTVIVRMTESLPDASTQVVDRSIAFAINSITLAYSNTTGLRATSLVNIAPAVESGAAPFTFVRLSGTANGLSLNGTTGAIGGRALVGSSTWNVRVTDSVTNTTTRSFTMSAVANDMGVSTPVVGTIQVHQNWDKDIQVVPTNIRGTASYSRTDPAAITVAPNAATWYSITETGLLSFRSPPTAGSFASVGFTVTDSADLAVYSPRYTVSVVAAPAITHAATTQVAHLNVLRTLPAPTWARFIGAPSNWSIVTRSGVAPADAAVSSVGVVTFTKTTPESWTYALTASDAFDGHPATSNDVTVTGVGTLALSYNPPSASIRQNAKYDGVFQPVVENSTGANSFVTSCTDNQSIPGGSRRATITGAGVPEGRADGAVGSSKTCTVTVTDSSGQQATGTHQFVVTPGIDIAYPTGSMRMRLAQENASTMTPALTNFIGTPQISLWSLQRQTGTAPTGLSIDSAAGFPNSAFTGSGTGTITLIAADQHDGAFIYKTVPYEIASSLSPSGSGSWLAYEGLSFNNGNNFISGGVGTVTSAVTGVPSGITFSVNGITTTVTGTPAIGSSGTYPVTFTYTDTWDNRTVTRVTSMSVTPQRTLDVPASVTLASQTSAAPGACTSIPVANVGSVSANIAFSLPATTGINVCTNVPSPCGSTLAAGSTCNFGARIDAVGVASYSGNAQVTVTGGNPKTVALSGESTYAVILASNVRPTTISQSGSWGGTTTIAGLYDGSTGTGFRTADSPVSKSGTITLTFASPVAAGCVITDIYNERPSGFGGYSSGTVNFYDSADVLVKSVGIGGGSAGNLTTSGAGVNASDVKKVVVTSLTSSQSSYYVAFSALKIGTTIGGTCQTAP